MKTESPGEAKGQSENRKSSKTNGFKDVRSYSALKSNKGSQT